MGALLKILHMTQPAYAAVLFDGECHNQRKDLDPCYKANRPDYSEIPEEETPFSQLPDIFRALQVMGIPYRETDCCEADDWIAGYALQYGSQMPVTIASQDSDFFQLISDNVKILRYRGQNPGCKQDRPQNRCRTFAAIRFSGENFRFHRAGAKALYPGIPAGKYPAADLQPKADPPLRHSRITLFVR